MKEFGASGYIFMKRSTKQPMLCMFGQPRGLPGKAGLCQLVRILPSTQKDGYSFIKPDAIWDSGVGLLTNLFLFQMEK